MGGCRRGDRGGLVRCRAGERVDEDEKLKRFLRGKGVPIPPSKKAASTPMPSKPDVDDDSIASLRFFDLDTVRQRWDVPWVEAVEGEEDGPSRRRRRHSTSSPSKPRRRESHSGSCTLSYETTKTTWTPPGTGST